jgi:hypothetical protein
MNIKNKELCFLSISGRIYLGGEMKRFGLLVMFLLVTAAAGCTSATNDVYYVMFDRKPNLFESGVYLQGTRIGQIVSTEAGRNNVFRVTIRIDSPYRDQITRNIAFLVSSGRLEYARIANYGEKLDYEAKVLGFQSWSSLFGFKLMNLMHPLPAAAAGEAQRLFELSS